MTLAGGAFPLLNIAWTRVWIWRLLAFGSGAFLGTAFMHIFPEALTLDPRLAGWGCLSALAFLFTLEGFTMIHSCPEYMEDCPVHLVGWSAFGALTLHGLIDGFIIAAAFRTSSMLGSTVSLALMFHKFSDGLTLSSLCLASQYSRLRSFVLSTLVALATPLGALAAFCLMLDKEPLSFAALLGFSAGAFVYVGAADTLPRIHKSRDTWCLILFLLSLFLVGIFPR